MPISVIFWVLMICWLVFGVAGTRPNSAAYFGWGGSLLLFILLFLLGWKAFGFIISG